MLVLGRARRAHVPDFPELIGTCVRCCPERVEQLATPRWARRCDRGGNFSLLLPYNRTTKGEYRIVPLPATACASLASSSFLCYFI